MLDDTPPEGDDDVCFKLILTATAHDDQLGANKADPRNERLEQKRAAAVEAHGAIDFVATMDEDRANGTQFVCHNSADYVRG